MARKFDLKAWALRLCLPLVWTVSSVQAGQDFALGAEPLAQRMNRADVVAAVRIDAALEQVNLALSQNGRIVSEGVSYQATLAAVWKGELPAADVSLSFQVPLSACYKSLSPGTEYLVFARLDQHSQWHFSSCQNFVLRSQVPRQFAEKAN